MAHEEEPEPISWRMVGDVAPWWIWVLGIAAAVPLVLGLLVAPMFLDDTLGDASPEGAALFLLATASPMLVVVALAVREHRRRARRDS